MEREKIPNPLDIVITNLSALAIDGTNIFVVDMCERTSCDVEMLINGGFAPLRGFMDLNDYLDVVNNMKCKGVQWALPVIYNTACDEFQSLNRDAVSAQNIRDGDHIIFKYAGYLVATMKISLWERSQEELLSDCKSLFGTTNTSHPAVSRLLLHTGKFISGILVRSNVPARKIACLSPNALKSKYSVYKNRVAFQTRNPVHKSHYALLKAAIEYMNKERPGEKTVVIIHPVMGPTKNDDFSPEERLRTYEAIRGILGYGIAIEYLPYSMWVGGPREALQHAIIRRNYNFTHMITGRDHAGCKVVVDGKMIDAYTPYEAQEFLIANAKGISILPFKNMCYVENSADSNSNGNAGNGNAGTYMQEDEIANKGLTAMNISGTEFRKMIANGDSIPEWYAFPEVVDALRN